MLTSYVGVHPGADQLDIIDIKRYLSRNHFEISNDRPVRLDEIMNVFEIRGSREAYKNAFKVCIEEYAIQTKEGNALVSIPKGRGEIPHAFEGSIADLIILFESFLMFREETTRKQIERYKNALKQYRFTEIGNVEKTVLSLRGCSSVYEAAFGIRMFPYIEGFNHAKPMDIEKPDTLKGEEITLSAPFPVAHFFLNS